MPRDPNGEIKLGPLVECFKKHYNLATSECEHLISFHNIKFDCFVLAGKFGNLKIPTVSDETCGQELRLKIRICLEQVVPSNSITLPVKAKASVSAKPKADRVKERKIGDVVAKVL